MRFSRKRTNGEGFKGRDHYIYKHDVICIYRYILISNDRINDYATTQHIPVRIMRTHTMVFKSFFIKKDSLMEIVKEFGL